MKSKRSSHRLLRIIGILALVMVVLTILKGALMGLSGLAESLTSFAMNTLRWSVSPAAHVQSGENFVSALVTYVLYGVGAAIITAAIAPKATATAVRAADGEPGRCLVTGVMGVVGIGLIMIVNNMLLRVPLWTPFAILLIILAIMAWWYAGLIGMAFAGGCIARRLGWGEIGYVCRVGLGLSTFALLYCVPFIGPWMFFVELLVAISGLGALVVTGMGSDKDWLSRRLRRG